MDVKTWLWIGVFLSVFLSTLVVSKERLSASDRFFVAWLVANGVHLLFYIHNIYHYTPTLNWLYRCGFSLSLVHYPLLFLYLCSSLGVSAGYTRWYGAHFIPYLLLTLALFLTSSTGSQVYKHGFLLWSGPGHGLQNYGILLALSGALYPIWGIYVLVRYQRVVLPQFYSFTNKVSYNWLKYWVLVSGISFLLIFFLIVSSTNIGWLPREAVFKLVGLVVVAHLVYVGFFGLRQTTLFYNFTSQQQDNKESKSAYSHQATAKSKKLRDVLQNDKPYLNPELTLTDLAVTTAMSTHELSFLINNEFKMNFYKLINQYRIDEFKRRLALPENKHMKILAIAFDCGFNSKSTFNKVFLEACGTTPSEYRSKVVARI